MKFLLLLGLAVVVIVSGCTVPGIGIEIPGIPDFLGGGGVVASGDLIVFKDVQAIPSTVKPGKDIKVVVNVQNVGRETEKVTIELFDNCPGLFTGVDFKEEVTVLPNEIHTVEFPLKANSGTKVKISCALKFSATYKGESESTTTLSFINQQEYEKQLQSGTFRTAGSQLKIGEGPVKVYMDVKDPQPVPSGSTAKVNLVVKNTGSGYVVGAKEPSVIEKGGIKITAPGVKAAANCAFLEDPATTPDFSTQTAAKQIKLIRKEASPMECTVELADSAKTFAGAVAKLITVQADYFYVIEKEVKVTVEP